MKSAAVLSSLALVIAFQFGASLAADKPTVLVIGAGQSGQPTVRILVEQGYDVRVMVRDPSRVTDLPAAAAVVAGDVTRPDSLQAAFAGIDYVISTIGSPCTPFEPFPEGSGPEDIDYRGVVNLTDAARQAGTKQLVLMSSLRAGSDDPEDRLNQMCGMVLAWKGKGEDYLRTSGVPYTVVRPGGLLPVPGQPQCSEGKVPLRLYPGFETGESAAICRADVGLVMIDALGNPDAVGKTVNLISETNEPADVDAWRSSWARMPSDQAGQVARHPRPPG